MNLLLKIHLYLLSHVTCFSYLTLPLQAYDQHLNMILGDVEETVTTIEIDEETYEEIYKVSPASLCFDNVSSQHATA